MAQMTAQEAAALIARLESLASNPPREILLDDSLRRKLRESAKNFSIAMEMPGDTIHRLGNTALQVSMARVGKDTKLFEILAGSEHPMNCGELAKKTGFDPVLLGM